MKYEKPMAEQIRYEAEDIITASSGCPGKADNFNNGGGQGCTGNGNGSSGTGNNGTRNNKKNNKK